MSKYKPLIRKAVNEIDKVIRDANATEDESLKFYFKYINLRFDTPEKKLELSRTRTYDNYARDNKDFFKHLQKTLQHSVLVKAFGEVFTPPVLVNEMLDLLPSSLWKNPNLKWLDNSCGSGHFLVAVHKRLMNGLKTVIPDKEQRNKHILENMIYGVDIQAKNVFSALFVLDKTETYDIHISQHDALTFNYWDTKFDVVVGNPPYQASHGKSVKLWHSFISKSMELLNDNGYLAYVTPKVFLHKPHTKQNKIAVDALVPYTMIYCDTTAKKHFPTIGEEPCFYIVQKSAMKTPCTFVFENGVTKKVVYDGQYISGNDEDAMKNVLIQRILAWSGTKISDIDYRDVNRSKDAQHWIDQGILFNEKQDGCVPVWWCAPQPDKYWMHKDNIRKGIKIVCNYMGTYYKPDSPDTHIWIDENDSVAIGASLGVICKDKTEAINIKSMLTSKLYRWFINNEKSSGFNGGLIKLPVLDTSKSYNDDEIYALFNITEDEKALIEKYLEETNN